MIGHEFVYKPGQVAIEEFCQVVEHDVNLFNGRCKVGKYWGFYIDYFRNMERCGDGEK